MHRNETKYLWSTWEESTTTFACKRSDVPFGRGRGEQGRLAKMHLICFFFFFLLFYSLQKQNHSLDIHRPYHPSQPSASIRSLLVHGKKATTTKKQLKRRKKASVLCLFMFVTPQCISATVHSSLHRKCTLHLCKRHAAHAFFSASFNRIWCIPFPNVV